MENKIKNVDKPKETHEQWLEKMSKIITDVQIETNPDIIKLRKSQKEAEDAYLLSSREMTSNFRRQILYFFVILIPIPCLILLWNVHIVLGILGIIGYIWLIANKIRTGYYFGY